MPTKTFNRFIQFADLVVGALTAPPHREEERGLSQSTENAVLLAGAVVIAGLVIAAVRAYVTSHMPS